MKGKIVFEKDSIIINDKVFELKGIKKLDFGFIDFYGQRDISYRGNVNPLISQGVSNFITFVDSTNQTQKQFISKNDD